MGIPSTWTRTAALVLLAASLGGCAALNSLESDVSTYATWPAQRQASTFVFERLPSQQARAQEQDQLEIAARPALQRAGFREVTDAARADTTVQLAVRVSRVDMRYYDDPLWWRSGLYYSRRNAYYGAGFGPWGPWGPWGPYAYGPGASFYFDTPRYAREAVVLIRDRAGHQVLYEARAASEGNSAGSPSVLAAMFEAAMTDFPNAGINPRRVTTQLSSNAPPR